MAIAPDSDLLTIDIAIIPPARYAMDSLRAQKRPLTPVNVSYRDSNESGSEITSSQPVLSRNCQSGIQAMTPSETDRSFRSSLDRRQLLAYAGFGAAVMTAGTTAAQQAAHVDVERRRYNMKKSINLWAFPYPAQMTLRQCLQLAKDAGFDGIELNYDLDNDLSPKSGTKEFTAIRKMAEEIGIAISGVCSFLFWPYPLTSNDPAERARGMELAGLMTQAAHDLGTKNLLVVPGAVHMPWRADHDPTPNDVCDQRARGSHWQTAAERRKAEGVAEHREHLLQRLSDDADGDECVRRSAFPASTLKVHFDTGNIMEYQFPEHWIPILGKRIRNVHLKEYTKKGTDHSLEAFRPLLDGTTNWPAVMEAFAEIGYDGYLTFEYFHPYLHYPEALIYQTADSLDRLLGIK